MDCHDHLDAAQRWQKKREAEALEAGTRIATEAYKKAMSNMNSKTSKAFKRTRLTIEIEKTGIVLQCWGDSVRRVLELIFEIANESDPDGPRPLSDAERAEFGTAD